MRARRLQMGCNINERNVEARRVRYLENTRNTNSWVQENMTTNTEF